MERTTRLIVVENGSIYRVVGGSLVAVSGGASALDPAARIASAAAFGRLYLCDGTDYFIYDGWTDTAYAWTASAGEMPDDSSSNVGRLLCLYRGRVVISGIEGDPHNWFMSAVDAPRDFDYEPDIVTEAVAVAGNNSIVGLVGDVITALAPLNDDMLVFGGDHTIYQLAGDPAAGGRIDLVSDVTGMAWNAWCKDSVGAIWFFGTRGGVYRYAPGGGIELKSRAIESRLNEVDVSTNIISLVWNDREKGVHLFITPSTVGAATHYFYDLRNEAWYEDVFANNSHNPTAVHSYDADDPDDRAILLGGGDGHIRRLDHTSASDDGTAIDSYVFIGPIQFEDRQHVLTELRAVLDDDSDNVALDIYVGDSPEAALASATAFTGTLSAGRNASLRPRCRGQSLYLRLRNNTLAETWAMERIQAVVKPLGAGTARIY
jgi:hypothetical protein